MLDGSVQIAPSILSADFSRLCEEIAKVDRGGADMIHLDIMDGHFVPNITYAMPIVEGLRRYTDLPLDVHLMISDPLTYAKPMVDVGADLLTFHVEAVQDPVEAAQRIGELGVAVGVALNPKTPLEKLAGCESHVDMVLVMSVEAGFGGQQFAPVSLEKLRALKDKHPDLLLEVDGGINANTIGPARQAGCDLFVVGSAIFRRDDLDDYGEAMEELTAAINAAGGKERMGQS